jgi:hypothetical protein
MRAAIVAYKGTTILFSAGLLALGCVAALAQQTTGVPGSPGATTTIDGNQLPPPDPKFGGVIEENALQSKAWWAPRVVPPKGAPNILLIMTDDCGFGAPSTFGGVIPTPALDRIARDGLRYTQFHSTALCSPTRAALITVAITTPLVLASFQKPRQVSLVTTASSLKMRRASERS